MSTEIEVKSDLASKETIVWSAGICSYLRHSLASKEFFSLCSDKFVKGVIIFDSNLEISLVGDEQKETIGRIGLPFLWIFINPFFLFVIGYLGLYVVMQFEKNICVFFEKKTCFFFA